MSDKNILRQEIRELRTINADLLEALKVALPYLPYPGMARKARTAVAKATGPGITRSRH